MNLARVGGIMQSFSCGVAIFLSVPSKRHRKKAASDSGDGIADKRARGAESILAAAAAYSMRPWDRHASRLSFREKRRGQSMLLARRHHRGSEGEGELGKDARRRKRDGTRAGRSGEEGPGARSRACNVCRLQECHYVSFARVR